MIHGGNGDDTIEGGGGADTLYGDDGNDLFYGAIDGDTIYGGQTGETAGGDTIDFLHVSNTPLNIVMGSNNNTNEGFVYANGSAIASSYFYEIENISGTSSNDTIRGDSRSNALYGGAGDDTISGGGGNDYIDGGTNTTGTGGGDWIDFYNDGASDINGITIDLAVKTQQYISATRGSDTIINIENIEGTDNNDVIWGDSAANYSSIHTILGMAGDDSIILRGGNNYIDGGSGTDTVSYYYENGVTVALSAGAGTATSSTGTTGTYTDALINIENITGSNNSNSTLAKDTITGDANVNTILGMAGDDTLDGGGGADYIDGGSDNDLLYGGTGADTIYGGAGNDNIYGNTNTAVDSAGVKNTLYGGSGYDTLHGDLSGDIIYGDSSAGARSGEGDWLYYDLVTSSGVHVDLSAMTAIGWNGTADIAGTNDTIGGIDNVYGSNQADYLVGTTSIETINGSGGNDTIVGNGGADSLYGGTGNDTFIFSNVAQMQTAAIINGGASAETNIVTLSSHSGNETITAGNMQYIQQIALANGSISSAAYIINTNSISIVGTAGSDYIVGGVGYTNTIDAGAGNDTVVFAVGDLLGDTVNGGADTDTLKLTGSSAITDVQFASITNFENLDLTGYSGTSITLGSFAHSAFGNAVINLATTYTAGTAVVTDVSGYGDGLTLNGGSGSDDVIISRGQTITVNGSTGTIDTLEFKDAGTIDSSNYKATISGIEQIKFSSLGSNNITLDASALTGSPTLVGGSNADTFNYSIANLSSADIIDGGAGNDTLNFLDAGTILGSAMSGITNVEVIKLFDNTISHTANNVSLGTVNATVYGGNQGDTYNYDIANLTSADTIFAGNGTDKLVITGSGTLTDSLSFTNLHSIETLDLNSFGGTTVSIGSTSLNTGINFVDASTRAAGIYIDSAFYAGAITVTGGLGNDTLTGSSLYMAQQTLNGGAGNDMLKITYGTAIDDSMFAYKSNFEVLDISAVTSSVILGTNAQNAGFLTLNSSNSTGQTIDVSADTIGTSSTKLAINAGTGADTIVVNNQNQYVSVDGGTGGVNTLKFASSLTGGQTGSSTAIGNVSFSHIQKIQLADTGNDIALDASAVGVTIIGGAGIDIFEYTPTNFSSADTLWGGAGNDTLLFISPSNAIDATAFGLNLTSIDVIQLADGGNVVTNYAYTNGSLMGGSSNDTINVALGSSSVKIFGGDGADQFNFANATDLANITTLVGGNQTDTVAISGSVNLNDTNFSKVSTVEALDISTLTANATIGSSAHTAGIITITDTGSFAKTIDISAFGNYALTINANGAADTNDIFTLDGAQTNVSVNAGSSTGDTLKITGSTAFSDTFFLNKTSTEILDITGSTATSVTLGTNAKTSGILTINDITDSTGKTINISADNIGNSTTRLAVNAGTGADTIIADSTNYYTINGGATGVNTLVLSNLLTASDAGSSTIIGNINYSNIGKVQLADGGNTVTFDLYTGLGTNISLVGGAGNDIFKYTIAAMNGDSLIGGAGNDTLVFTDAGTIAQASLSGVDFTTANKIEVIQFANGTNDITVDKDNVTLIGGSGIDTFNYAVANLSVNDTIDGGGGSSDTLKLTGGSFSDTVLTHMTHVENIDLTGIAASSTVTITAQSNTDGVTQITDTGANGKNIDASAFGNALLAINAGSANDTITLDGGEILVSVVGGSGTDILALQGTTSVNDGYFANKTQLETLNLTAMNANVTLGTSAAASGITTITDTGANGKIIDISADSAISSISTGSGNDIIKVTKSQVIAVSDTGGTDTLQITDQIVSGGISATSLTGIEKIQLGDFANSVTMDYNGKTLIGGSGNDVFNYSGTGNGAGQFSTNDTINGGTSGTDILAFATAGTIDATQFSSNLTNIAQIQLANGTNIVTGYSYTNGTLMGATGNDTITIASGTNGAKIYTGTGADVVNVTSVTDLNNSTIDGGTDGVTDKIVITGTAGGAINALHVSNIDEIDLASGAGAYTINTNISIVGSSGADSIIGGVGVNNTISAGSGDDVVEFDVANLTSADIVFGGTQSVADIFRLKGSANDVSASMLSNIKEFEILNIDSTMTKNITLDSTDSGFTSITDSGTASQTIDVSAYTGLSSVTMGSTGAGGDTLVVASSQSIAVTGGAGSTDTIQLSNLITGGGNIAVTGLTNIEKIKLANGTNSVSIDKDNISIVGGTGDDTFNYAVGNLSSSDIIDGGSGTNTLKITGSGTVNDGMFTHVTNIEKLDLSGYTGGVTLGTNADNNAGLEVVLNSAGMTIDASAFTTALKITGSGSANETITAGTANNTIVTGNGTNTITIMSAGFDSSDTITGGSGTDTLKLTGNTALTAANFAGVSNFETLDLSSYTGTIIYGAIAIGFTTISFGSGGATLSADASVISGISAMGTNGTLHVSNLQSKLDSSFTNVVSALSVSADWASGTAIYTGNLTNIDSLSISGGTMIVNDSILGTMSVSGAGSLTVNADDSSLDASNVNISGTLTINDTSGTQTLHGSANADIFNINNALSTSDGANGSDTYNASVATNITDTGTNGTDVLHVTANGLDFSDKTISGIETLDLGTTTGTTLSGSEITAFTNVTGSGNLHVNSALNGNINLSAYSGDVTIDDANGKNVTLGGGNDTITTTSGGTVSMGGGNDHLSLDFSNIGSLTMDGGAGNDTVSLFGTNAAALTSTSAFSNIETLDIHSLGLSSGGLAIDANALYAFTGTNAGHSLTLDASTADLTAGHLSISGISSWTEDGGAINTGSSLVLDSGSSHVYSLTDTNGHVTDLHVLAV